MYIEPNGNVHPCCTARSVLYGNTNTSSLQEIWNGDAIKKFRDELVAGVKQEACEFCYTREQFGNDGSSLRTHFNKLYLEDVVENPEMKLKYVDVRPSNICNFACVMCGPHLSSNWHDDAYAIFGTVKHPKFIKISDKTRQEILDNLIHAEHVYFAGGEPLITDFHWDILDWLAANNKNDVGIRYNTNLSVLSYKNKSVFDYWKKFKNVKIAASIDLDGPRGEYHRHGLSWKKFVENWRLIAKECPHITLTPHITTTCLTVGYLPEFLDSIQTELNHRGDFDFNIAQGPKIFNPVVLPTEVKRQYKEKLMAYLNRSNVQGHINIINSVTKFLSTEDYDNEEFKNTLQFLTKLDIIRDTDWRKLWPEFIPYSD
jgi:hypothetical protein